MIANFIRRRVILQQMQRLLAKPTAGFVMVYGRRRIGKSSLISHFCRDYLLLAFEELSQSKALTKQDQLDEFSRQIAHQCHTQFKRFTDWSDALGA